jgi:hypothetical protein
MAKSRRIKLAGHIARMGYMKIHTTFFMENIVAIDHLGDLGVDQRIIIKLILGK